MFTAEHMIWIALCAGFVAGMSVFSTRRALTLRQAGLVMSAIGLLSELSKMMSNLEPAPGGGMRLDPHALPLHLCSLMLFGVFFLTLGRPGRAQKRLINFMAVMGTLGSVCAILIPTNGTDFRSLPAYQCFVYHGGLLWFSLHLIRSGQAELGSLKTLRDNLGLLAALVFGMLYLNGALSAYDTNFFYLTRPPMENLPYLNLNCGWYVYFLRLLLLGVGAVTAFHLPFLLKARKRKPAGC